MRPLFETEMAVVVIKGSNCQKPHPAKPIHCDFIGVIKDIDYENETATVVSAYPDEIEHDLVKLDSLEVLCEECGGAMKTFITGSESTLHEAYGCPHCDIILDAGA